MRSTGRAFLLVISLGLSPAIAAAQGPGSRFAAVVGGATLSDMAGLASTSDSRWGATAGLLFGVNTWRTAITFEGNYIQKGGGDTRLDYIELPLTIGAIVPAGTAGRVRVYGGASVGFKVSCDTDLVGLDCDDASGTEWGLPLGIQFGRSAPSGGTFFAFDIRYTFALSDVFETVDVYNRPWQFRLMFGKVLGLGSE
jgi:hypothetical protein